MNGAVPQSWPELPGVRTLLCIGAHSDDIEIGCGGTLLRLREANPGLRVVWVVMASGSEERRAEAAASAKTLMGTTLDELNLLDFRERYLPYDSAVKSCFDEMGVTITPDLVFCPRTSDLHQDHRTVAQLTWNTFRSQPIWEYEIVKYEGDLGHPNLYVPLMESHMDLKVAHLIEAFPSQATRHWFKSENFRAIARIRGVECKSESGYAEAFDVRKVVVG